MVASVNNLTRGVPAGSVPLTHAFELDKRWVARVRVRAQGSLVDHGATLRRAQSAVPELPAVLPAYTMGETIGRGTFALVYAGRHVALGRDVAIKRLWPDLVPDSDARLRFGAEARVLAALDHPNIVRVYDYVEQNVFAIVLERMHGGTLHALLRGGRVSVKSACAITRALLDALEHAHRRGVLHRDVKPQNVMFGEQGEVKLADFGLAKVFGTDTCGPLARSCTRCWPVAVWTATS